MLRFLTTSAPTVALPALLLLAAAWGGAACGGSTNLPDGGGVAGNGTGGDSDDGASSGGASTGGGANGSGGGSGPACVDEACDGKCTGTTCEGAWTCETQVGCTDDIAFYCGCDGVTFQGSGSCAQRAYAHKGECDAVNCDPADISCLPIVAPEPCPQGQVYSVENNCYGKCVPIAQCACSSGGQACPEPEQYVCHNSAGHCDYYVE